MLKLLENLNLNNQEILNLSFEISNCEKSKIPELLLQVISGKFSELNCNLEVLLFLEKNNFELEDSKKRMEIIDNVIELNFYSMKPNELKKNLLKITDSSNLEFCFTILSQMNIPAAFLRVCCLEILHNRKYVINCFNRILSSKASNLEKMLTMSIYCSLDSIESVEEIDELGEFSVYFAYQDYYKIKINKTKKMINSKLKNDNYEKENNSYFFKEHNRNSGCSWYCGIHNSKKYYICSADNKPDLNNDDCLIGINLLKNNIDFLECMDEEIANIKFLILLHNETKLLCLKDKIWSYLNYCCLPEERENLLKLIIE